MINRGARFTISNLSLTIGPDGALASDATFTLALDLTAYWLEIAVSEARIALQHHADLLEAARTENQNSVNKAMEAECKASMQTFSASAIALDAFYAAVKEHVFIPEELVARWRTNRTARYKQIAEVFRQAFKVGPRSAVRLRNDIRQIFEWRDRTVHPPSSASKAVLYEELSVGTEWRFVAFRARNARLVASTALSIIAQLLSRPRNEHAGLVGYCGPALTNIQPTVDEWEREFGALYDRNASRDAV